MRTEEKKCPEKNREIEIVGNCRENPKAKKKDIIKKKITNNI